MKLSNVLKTILVSLLIISILNWGTLKDIVSLELPITGDVVAESQIPEEYAPEPEVYFCPRNNCSSQLIAWLNSAEEYIHCAFFEVELESLKTAFNQVSEHLEVKIITDSDYADQITDLSPKIEIKEDKRSAFMHNKFCILDGKAVWTGSFNPTHRGDEKNNNNAILIQSQHLAENYETEFREMWSGTFGKGGTVENPKVKINNNLYESYFCPEDWCVNKVLHELNDAKHSVYFMTFSFTHDQIGKELIRLAEDGLDIKGVFEKSQNSAYTEYKRLTNVSSPNIAVLWDKNPANLHHKVFMIDNKTVITGSFNPTANGDTRNDENLLIIHNKNITSKFSEEFKYVWEQAQT